MDGVVNRRFVLRRSGHTMPHDWHVCAAHVDAKAAVVHCVSWLAAAAVHPRWTMSPFSVCSMNTALPRSNRRAISSRSSSECQVVLS